MEHGFKKTKTAGIAVFGRLGQSGFNLTNQLNTFYKHLFVKNLMEGTQPGGYFEKWKYIKRNIMTNYIFCIVDLSRTRCEQDIFVKLSFKIKTPLSEI